MRIGVFHNKPYYLRHYETTLRALIERGHDLLLARPDRFEEVFVPGWLRKSGAHVTTGLYPSTRSDGLAQSVEILRTARDAARYLRPELTEAEASRRRELDVVFCISRVNIAAPQTEVVKAAAALGVPTGIAVYSWDNLTNKGTLHTQPDRLFVWNDLQVREAVELHGVDPERVVATGAPRFDAVFAREASAPATELLAELGLDPARRTVLYLGSSAFVAPREPEFVDEWLGAVRDRLPEVNVIVRPHPGTLGKPAWIGWTPGVERVAVAGTVRRTRDQDLLDQLSVSDAVVGLNTSAEIEAAILDRPVLTVKAAAHAPGQEGQLHFRYLLEEEGGFVRTTAGLAEHAAQLVDALERDPLAAARRRFLETFVRPRGLDRPAGPALADAIEALAEKRGATPAVAHAAPA
jgi:hypothetical protein